MSNLFGNHIIGFLMRWLISRLIRLHLSLVHFATSILAAIPEKRSSGFLTRSNTNWPVQSQKKVKILKFMVDV